MGKWEIGGNMTKQNIVAIETPKRLEVAQRRLLRLQAAIQKYAPGSGSGRRMGCVAAAISRDLDLLKAAPDLSPDLRRKTYAVADGFCEAVGQTGLPGKFDAFVKAQSVKRSLYEPANSC